MIREPGERRERARRAQILPAACAGLIAAGAIVGAGMYARPEPSPEPPPPGVTVANDALVLDRTAPSRALITTHKTDEPEPQWREAIPARIVFDETRTSRLGAPLAGRITAVFAERGQMVHRGDALYAVSSARLADLVADRQRAQVELSTAKVNFERVRQAIQAEVLAEKDLLAATQEVEHAKLGLELAEEKLRSLEVARANHSELRVTAPRDGVVVERSVAIGQSVSPESESLIAIADLSSVWVVANVFGNVADLRPGTRARVIQPAPGETFDAVVDHVAPVVDPERHGVAVRIKLDNPRGLLRPNAFLQVRLADPTPSVGTLPASAVLTDGDHSYVYVEDPAGTFRRRNVEVGAVHADRVAVISGLTRNDTVVVQGAILIDNAIALGQSGGS